MVSLPRFVLVLCFSIVRAVAADESSSLVVTTLQGNLEGTQVDSEIKNETYYAFYGIPYAQKPIGDKRFKDPEEPVPWNGTFDAKEEGNACHSFNPIFQNVAGDEDCLNLNVYTRKPPQELRAAPRPVMVWIHGGAFHMGSNSPLYYGPDFLMLEDIVLVTINYRLSVFGFLSLENEDIPGNAGLKDQVMALKWIKANINSFGGNPDNVTIFGESAGGASVHYLILSPSARGLFQRAILQSGTAISPWAATNSTLDTAKKLGEVFDCETGNLTELARCLRQVDSEELTRFQYNVLSPILTEPPNFKIFLPCIESKQSRAPFLVEEPRKLVREGQFADIPIMIGTTELETLFLVKVLSSGGFLPERVLRAIYSHVNKNPWFLLGTALDNVPVGLRRKIGQEIKRFYFGDAPISEDTIVNMINATSDINFLIGVDDVINYHLSKGTSSVYQYHFTADTEFGRVKKLLGTSIKGPSHGDDVGYLFLIQLAPPDLDPSSAGYKTMLNITKLWTNFAKFGNPTPDREQLNVEWKIAARDRRYYLDIGEELSLKEHLEKKRIQFWSDLRRGENLLHF